MQAGKVQQEGAARQRTDAFLPAASPCGRVFPTWCDFQGKLAFLTVAGRDAALRGPSLGISALWSVRPSALKGEHGHAPCPVALLSLSWDQVPGLRLQWPALLLGELGLVNVH